MPRFSSEHMCEIITGARLSTLAFDLTDRKRGPVVSRTSGWKLENFVNISNKLTLVFQSQELYLWDKTLKINFPGHKLIFTTQNQNSGLFQGWEQNFKFRAFSRFPGSVGTLSLALSHWYSPCLRAPTWCVKQGSKGLTVLRMLAATHIYCLQEFGDLRTWINDASFPKRKCHHPLLLIPKIISF